MPVGDEKTLLKEWAEEIFFREEGVGRKSATNEVRFGSELNWKIIAWGDRKKLLE